MTKDLLTEAQFSTLEEIADPNYKGHNKRSFPHDDAIHYFGATLKALERKGMISLEYQDEAKRWPKTVTLLQAGRDYLTAHGVTVVELRPPPKSQKEYIEALEAGVDMAINAIAQTLAWLDSIEELPDYDELSMAKLNLTVTALMELRRVK